MTWSKKKKAAVAAAGAGGLILAAVAGTRGAPPQGPVYQSAVFTVLAPAAPDLATVLDVSPPAYQSYLPEGNIADYWSLSVAFDSVGDTSRAFVFYGELYDSGGALIATTKAGIQESQAQPGVATTLNFLWDPAPASLSGAYSAKFFPVSCTSLSDDPTNPAFCRNAGPEFDKSFGSLSYGMYCAFQTFQVPCYDTEFLVTDMAGNPLQDAQVNAVCDANPSVCNLLAPTGVDGKARLRLPFYGVDVATNYFTVTVTAIFSGQQWANTVRVYVPRDGLSFTIPVGPTNNPPPPSSQTVAAAITATDPTDAGVARYWELWLDKAPTSYLGSGVYDPPADSSQVHHSGETMSVSTSLSVGPHYLYFVVTASKTGAAGTYAGTITLDGAPPASFSGVKLDVFARVDFTVNSDGSVSIP